MDIINKYIYPHELSVGTNVYCVQEKHDGIIIEEDGIKKLYIKELEKTIDLSNRRVYQKIYKYVKLPIREEEYLFNSNEIFIFPHVLSVGTTVCCMEGVWNGVIIEEKGIKKLHIKEINKNIDLSNRRDGFYGMIVESSGLSESCLNR